MEIQYVWFDIGYTLLYMQRETTYQKALQEFGADISIEALDRGFHITDKLFMRQYPGVFLKGSEVYMPWYLGMLNDHLGVHVGVCEINQRWEEIKAEVRDYWQPFEGAAEVLTRLRAESIGLGVISNWDLTAREILDRAGLLKYFDHVIISEEVGCHKPSRQIFELALNQADVPPDRCLYVGDNYYDDAVGSRKLGMHPVIVNRYGRLGIEEINDSPVVTDLAEVIEYVRQLKTNPADQPITQN